MAGEYVPLVMVPRFTTYIGAAVYTTVALDVSEYYLFFLTVWRGPLIGAVATGAALSAVFEASEDAEVWTEVLEIVPITTANTHSFVRAPLFRKWLRMKLTLSDDADAVVALTCWATGYLEQRARNS